MVAAGFDSNGVIRAGGIAHDAVGVVGLTNLFADWAEAAANGLARLLPDRDLVGYESLDNLKVSEAQGFASLGALRIWV
jgi:hypothetical protein